MNLPMGLNADKITAAVADLKKQPVKKVEPTACRPTVPRLSDLESLRQQLSSLLEHLRGRQENVSRLRPHVVDAQHHLKSKRKALEAFRESVGNAGLREAGDTVYNLECEVARLESQLEEDQKRLDHNQRMADTHKQQIADWKIVNGAYFDELIALDRLMDKVANRYSPPL